MNNATRLTVADVAALLEGNCIPRGYAYTLVKISLDKRFLLCKIPAAERLKILEGLNVDSSDARWLTPDMIAKISPMDDKGYEIASEAIKLGAGKVLDVFADHFATFATLNPSLVAALEMMPGNRGRARAAA